MTTHIKNLIFTCLSVVSVLLVRGQVPQQDPTNLTQEFSIKLGDATVELTQKMNAAQWENFRQSALMNDVAIAKRDLDRSMSTYLLDDFKREIDEMNRSVKMTVTIRGYAKYDGGGNWEVKSDTKNPQVTKLTDNAYMIIGNAAYSGQLVQQITKVFFPDGSANVQQSTDAFGSTIFTYKLGGGVESLASWNNIVGLLLILAAIGLFIKGSRVVPLKKA